MTSTNELLSQCDDAVLAAERLLAAAKSSVAAKVGKNGRVDGAALDTEQRAAHGFAWMATYVECLKQLARWAHRLSRDGKLGTIEQLLLQAGFGEYLGQLVGGIPMSQNEIVRPYDLGLSDDDSAAFWTPAVSALAKKGMSREVRSGIADYLAKHTGAMFVGEPGLDETMHMVREQFFRFAQEKVTPFAHQWHMKDELIPIELIAELSELGVFGLTIPETYGGAGLSKTAMCVVSEELSRGYIGVGSLATRSEIAAELILNGGTKAQKDKWLPKIASGEILPTAVFTEPSGGSDVAELRTRGTRAGDTYTIHGNKTWITHAARADLMTLLVRTRQDVPGYRGLSMFLAESPVEASAIRFPSRA